MASPRRMSLHCLLVNVRAPAGLGWDDQVTVLYARQLGDEIILPGNVIDVDLHDAAARYPRAEGGAHRRPHWPVVPVRRAVSPIARAHASDLRPFAEFGPGHFDKLNDH